MWNKLKSNINSCYSVYVLRIPSNIHYCVFKRAFLCLLTTGHFEIGQKRDTKVFAAYDTSVAHNLLLKIANCILDWQIYHPLSVSKNAYTRGTANFANRKMFRFDPAIFQMWKSAKSIERPCARPPWP